MWISRIAGRAESSQADKLKPLPAATLLPILYETKAHKVLTLRN